MILYTYDYMCVYACVCKCVCVCVCVCVYVISSPGSRGRNAESDSTSSVAAHWVSYITHTHTYKLERWSCKGRKVVYWVSFGCILGLFWLHIRLSTPLVERAVDPSGRTPSESEDKAGASVQAADGGSSRCSIQEKSELVVLSVWLFVGESSWVGVYSAELVVLPVQELPILIPQHVMPQLVLVQPGGGGGGGGGGVASQATTRHVTYAQLHKGSPLQQAQSENRRGTHRGREEYGDVREEYQDVRSTLPRCQIGDLQA